MKVLIGDHWFSSKAAALTAIRAVLYRYAPGMTVMEPDATFLAAVLERHPEVALKVGPGVASFQVEQNLGSRGFWLTRIDGSRTDWSFLSCLTPPTPIHEVKTALRTEVRDQIVAFKAAQYCAGGLVPCAVTNVLLPPALAHVDHDPPFEMLVKMFFGDTALAQILVSPTTDRETDTWLVDRTLATQWAAFHKAYAGLRIVSRVANLSLLKQRL